MTDTNATTSFSSEVEKVGESGAQAVFFAGGTGTGTVALWKQLHGADPKLLLLGSSDMVNSSFTSAIGAAAASTYLTTPILPANLYPPAAAQRARGISPALRRRRRARMRCMGTRR